MKSLLAVFIFLSIGFMPQLVACDMFDAELSIVQDQMKSLEEDVKDCVSLVATAEEEKNKATDEKIMRLVNSIQKQADQISHSITQISLRKECACEGFDFELVNQKIIEVKYYIKRAGTADLAKQKSDQYATLKTNVNKLSDVLTPFAKYLYDPCKTAKPPLVEPEPEEPKTDTLLAEEAAPTPLPEETDSIPELPVVEEPAPVMDTITAPTVVIKDTVPTPEPIVEEPAPQMDTVTAPIVVAMDTVAQEEPVVEEVPPAMDTVTAPVVTVIDTVVEPEIEPVVLMDTVTAPTVIVDSITPPTDTVPEIELPEVELPTIDTAVTVEVVEEEPQVMDTIKTVEVPEIEDVVEEVPEETIEIMEPEVSIPTPKPVVVPAPIPVKPQPEPKAVETEQRNADGLYYAVQVAAGADETMPAKLSGLNENIYIVEEGGLNKFRIGRYPTLNEAINTKNSIFKKGITDAFIVAYNNGNKIGIGEARKLESGTSITPAPIASAPAKAKPVRIKNKSEVFLAVQVGASVTAADPIFELAKYEHQLQLRVKVIQGAPVRYYTGETKDQNEVEQTLSLVKSKGVESAFLIGIVDGERADYKEALEYLKQ